MIKLPVMNWDFWSRLFDSSGFMPRRICGTWTQDLIWLHNASDFGIWTAYLAIPIVLVLFAWKRRNELPFRSLFWLFGLFIVACGTTHLLDIVMFYNPVYRLSGLVKLVTAAASWGTVIALFRVLPHAMALQTPGALEREIQERRRAEEEVRLLNNELENRVRARTAELQASTERFAAIVSSSAHIIWTRNKNGEFVTPQPSWTAFSGQGFEELKGIGWQEVVHPDDRARVRQAWERAVEDGRFYEIEYRMRRHDGVYRDMHVRGVPVRDEAGKIREWVGTNTDITERKQAEAEVRESEARKSSILRSALDCVIGIDHESAVIEWNPAAERTFGYARGEALGKKLPELIIPESMRAAHYQGMARYLETGRAAILNQRIEVPAIRRDGTEFPAELAVTRIEGDGAPLFTAYLRDITQRKQAEVDLQRALEAAETANKTKSLFLANMSHELRTPLNAILGYSEMLEEEAHENGQDDLVPDLQRINIAGKHLLALINDVLDLSKIEAGKMQLFIEEFELCPVVQDLARTSEALVRKNHNTLIFECDDSVGLMRSDLTKVRQSVLNLLSNAGKFTNNGTVTLKVRREEMDGQDWICIEVSDTGIGLSAEQIVKLFRPFTQADATTTRRFGGTGLGLALTRRFCQMLGGDVTVSSTLGEGSSFLIKIPAVLSDNAELSELSAYQPHEAEEKPAHEETAIQVVEGENPESWAAPGTCVLVIDDDSSQRAIIQHYLNRQGFLVHTAGGGAQGLQLARRLKPLAITLDVMMPDMDGWSVLAELKSDPELQDTPVIMLTMVDDKTTGYTIGASEYLTKPVHRERLAQVLKKYAGLDRRQPILIVEDNPDIRSLLRIMLEAEGWKVIEAADGNSALECVETQTPALILLDLMMPQMDGFEFTAKLRRHSVWSKLPIVVLTSMELTDEQRLLLNGSVQKVVQKSSLSRDDLLEQVHRLVEGYRS